MADYDEDEDFFEEDEPAEKIHAAFEQGEKGVTGPPPPPVHFNTVVTVAPSGPVTAGQVGHFVTTAPTNRGDPVLVG